MAEKTKYTKNELNKFEEIINRKLKMARDTLQDLSNQLSGRGNNGTDDTARKFKSLDEGTETLSQDEITRLAARQQKFVQALENALIRIKNGTYGVCRVTGQLIAKERLNIVPHATLSIKAKQAQGRVFA